MCLGIPGKIIAFSDTGKLTRSGAVDFEGIEKEVNLALVEEAGVGDYVLVHAGIAISQIDEQEAARVYEYLKQIEGSEVSAPEEME